MSTYPRFGFSAPYCGLASLAFPKRATARLHRLLGLPSRVYNPGASLDRPHPFLVVFSFRPTSPVSSRRWNDTVFWDHTAAPPSQPDSAERSALWLTPVGAQIDLAALALPHYFFFRVADAPRFSDGSYPGIHALCSLEFFLRPISATDVEEAVTRPTQASPWCLEETCFWSGGLIHSVLLRDSVTHTVSFDWLLYRPAIHRLAPMTQNVSLSRLFTEAVGPSEMMRKAWSSRWWRVLVRLLGALSRQCPFWRGAARQSDASTSEASVIPKIRRCDPMAKLPHELAPLRVIRYSFLRWMVRVDRSLDTPDWLRDMYSFNFPKLPQQQQAKERWRSETVQ